MKSNPILVAVTLFLTSFTCLLFSNPPVEEPVEKVIRFTPVNVSVVETKNKTSLIVIAHDKRKGSPNVSLKTSLADEIPFSLLLQLNSAPDGGASEGSVITIYELMASREEFEIQKEHFNAEGYYFLGRPFRVPQTGKSDASNKKARLR